MAAHLKSSDVFHALLFSLCVCLGYHLANSEPTEDKQALLAFISKIAHSNRLQWNASDSACNWVGVICDANQASVQYLRLPGVGLVGQIPPNTLGRLTELRVLSLRSNGLVGSIPSDFSNLKSLRSLYLQNNQFSGGFPPSIMELTRLTRLDISSNNLTGLIPFSVNNLTQLTGLFMENNGFTGTLPSINPAGLADFNVSNNQLNGSVPSSLSRFPASAFSGNTELCGQPLPPCNPFFASPTPAPSVQPQVTLSHKKSKKLSTAAIIGIAVGAALALLLLLLICVFCLRTKKRKVSKEQKPTVGTRAPAGAVGEAGTSSSKEDMTGGSAEAERNKLIFFGGGGYNFDLEDLLRASAEVLGKGSVGSRGSGRTPLDWDSRMKIAVSAARGLAHLHASGKVVHGNIKSSNMLLHDKDIDACVSDYGLNTLFSAATLPNHRVAGYRAPEVLETRKATFKSDVYSFGVLLLELLTGKAPNQASLGEEGIDLPRWVQSVVREEWTAEVFDVELMRYHNVEEEMVQLLQIAMTCVATVPDQRPEMTEVVRMIENMNRGDSDDALRQSSDDPSKGSDVQTPPTGSRTSPLGVTP
ncbi:hypothetical protein Leryth_007889 [Lithospermum erythrorhizon]|nr:hypothetical protein Leryth_007889 [Lithospermum erythrorhizon]